MYIENASNNKIEYIDFKCVNNIEHVRGLDYFTVRLNTGYSRVIKIQYYQAFKLNYEIARGVKEW